MKTFPMAFGIVLASIFTCACSERTRSDHSDNDNRALASRNADSVRSKQSTFDSASYAALTLKDFDWGGMMYNKWWATNSEGTLDASLVPLNDNATWTASSNANVTGSQTWRCKSCHGWDYAGRDGQNANPQSKYYTGYPGIITTAAFVPQTIGNPQATFTAIDTGTLPDGRIIADHNFGNYIQNPAALHALTQFVEYVRAEALAPFPGTTIQGSPTSIINNLAVIANQADGYERYHAPTPNTAGTPVNRQGGCDEGCHGSDGGAIVLNGGDPALPSNITQAILDNPAEALHKIRFGQVGTTPPMPGLDWYDNRRIISRGSLVAAVNILAYARDGILADHARGGRLFDDWVTETGANSPSPANPLLAIRNPNPNDIPTNQAWLCSRCHGFDYEGVSGFQNNLVDLKVIRSWNPGYLYQYLKNGRAAMINGQVVHAVHSFSEWLNDVELWNLAEFLNEGVESTHTYVSLGLGGRAIGEGIGLRGEQLYLGNMRGVLYTPPIWACIQCHSDNGTGTGNGLAITKPPLVDVFAASWRDTEAPWRMFHRVRFGVPGLFDLDGDGAANERMPGLTEIILSSQADPTQPLDEKIALGRLTQRSIDIVTYAQDQLMVRAPLAIITVRQSIGAKTANFSSPQGH